MMIVERNANMQVSYDETFKCFILYEQLKNQYVAVAKLAHIYSDRNVLPLGDYIEVTGNPVYNLIKLNKGSLMSLDNRPRFYGNVTMYR